MGIILKCQSQNLSRQWRINFLSCDVNNHAVRIQLGSQVVASCAVAVHVRCFDDHAWGIFVRRSRNLHVHVTVGVNQSCELHKRVPDVVEVQLTALARGIRCGLRIDQREVQNIGDADFDGRLLRQINVLGRSPVIRAGRLCGCAVAEVTLSPFCNPPTAGPLDKQNSTN